MTLPEEKEVKDSTSAPLRDKKSIEKRRLCVLVPSRQNQTKHSKTAKNANASKTMKKTLPCKNQDTSNL